MQLKRTIPLDCYPCLFEQLLSLSRMLDIGQDDAYRLFEESMRRLMETKGEGIAVQHLIRSATDMALALSGKEPGYDPYGALKQHSNALALTVVEAWRERILHAPDVLEQAVAFAAAGNIIDFGVKGHAAIDVAMELEGIDRQRFGRFDFEAFVTRLESSKKLLYLCDNAGEIVFDRLFIEAISQEFPHMEVTCAMRERPVINDAVVEDAMAVGLHEVAKVVSSGSVYPGTLLEEASAGFLEQYRDADLIIAKGQGNLETLIDGADRRLFFILRIKCERMASLSGVAKGELVLMQGGRGPMHD